MVRLLAGFIWLCCLGLAGCAPRAGVAAAPPADRVPDGWDPAKIAGRWLDAGEAVADARVLVWTATEDNRPFRLEEAVVWARVEGRSRLWPEGGSRWQLERVYRNRQGAAPFAAWELNIDFANPKEFTRGFDHPPTGGEVEEFLRASGWDEFEANGRALPDGAVCAHAWKAATGQWPTRAAAVVPATPVPPPPFDAAEFAAQLRCSQSGPRAERHDAHGDGHHDRSRGRNVKNMPRSGPE